MWSRGTVSNEIPELTDGNLNLLQQYPLYGRVGIYTHEIPIAFYHSSWPIQRREEGVLNRQRLCVFLLCSRPSTSQYTLCMLIKSLRTSPTQPPPTPNYLISYPAPHVILVTINRPKAMNSLPYAAQWEADTLFNWFDNEPSLRVAVITGAGDKAFCAGQDLIEQARIKTNPQPRQMMTHPFSGFAGISRRAGKKPILAAVNGFALGGGFEICLNW